jgi:hypothetical protein
MSEPNCKDGASKPAGYHMPYFCTWDDVKMLALINCRLSVAPNQNLVTSAASGKPTIMETPVRKHDDKQ